MKKNHFHTSALLLVDNKKVDWYSIDTSSILKSDKLSKKTIEFIKQEKNKFKEETLKMDNYIKENSRYLPDDLHKRIEDLLEKHSHLDKWLHGRFNDIKSKNPEDIAELLHYKQSLENAQFYKRDKIEEVRHEEMMKLINQRLTNHPEHVEKYLQQRNERIEERKEFSSTSQDAYHQAKQELIDNINTPSDSDSNDSSTGPGTGIVSKVDPDSKRTANPNSGTNNDDRTNKDGTNSTSSLGDKPKKKSLLDDYADTSLDMPDYTGGDD